MKRLTVDTDLSFCDIAQCDSIPGGSFCEDGRCDQRRCYEKLREYERSDLEPETLQKVQGLLKELKDARQTVELMDACGKRVCSSEEHWGCPYGNEGMTDCAVLLEAAYEDTIEKLLAQQAVRDEKTRRFTLQQCKDMMLITMHEDFGWGEERLKKLSDCYDQTFMTYAEMCLADAKTDKQIWFTQGKVDECLKKACGKYFVPWDERYR